MKDAKAGIFQIWFTLVFYQILIQALKKVVTAFTLSERRKREKLRMKNYAKVLIEKKRLSSLQESISIGKQVIERKLEAYQKKAAQFEQAEGIRPAKRCNHLICLAHFLDVCRARHTTSHYT